jgi:DNA-binding NtrC family response regulator
MPRRLRVLVVSSEPENGRALGTLLAAGGLDAIVTATLADARDLLSHKTIRLIFCDAQLADGSFRELLALAEPQQIPVIVASRLVDTPHYLEAMQLGAFDFVAMPFRRGEVEQIVASAVRQLAARPKPTAGRSSLSSSPA